MTGIANCNFVLNEEFLVIASHHLAMISSLLGSSYPSFVDRAARLHVGAPPTIAVCEIDVMTFRGLSGAHSDPRCFARSSPLTMSPFSSSCNHCRKIPSGDPRILFFVTTITQCVRPTPIHCSPLTHSACRRCACFPPFRFWAPLSIFFTL
jgi:hypothetical protein